MRKISLEYYFKKIFVPVLLVVLYLLLPSPLACLKHGDVNAASVVFLRTDGQMELETLSEQDISLFFALLKNASVSKLPSLDRREYSGGEKMFRVKYPDGTAVDISVMNDWLVLGDTRYDCDKVTTDTIYNLYCEYARRNYNYPAGS